MDDESKQLLLVMNMISTLLIVFYDYLLLSDVSRLSCYQTRALKFALGQLIPYLGPHPVASGALFEIVQDHGAGHGAIDGQHRAAACSTKSRTHSSRALAGGTLVTTLYVTNVHCQSCILYAEDVLTSMKGVAKVHISIADHSIRVEHQGDVADTITRELTAAAFEVRHLKTSDSKGAIIHEYNPQFPHLTSFDIFIVQHFVLYRGLDDRTIESDASEQPLLG